MFVLSFSSKKKSSFISFEKLPRGVTFLLDDSLHSLDKLFSSHRIDTCTDIQSRPILLTWLLWMFSERQNWTFSVSIIAPRCMAFQLGTGNFSWNLTQSFAVVDNQLGSNLVCPIGNCEIMSDYHPSRGSPLSPLDVRVPPEWWALCWWSLVLVTSTRPKGRGQCWKWHSTYTY